jgi:hypothetical protein
MLMKLDRFEILVYLATMAFLALVTVAWIGMVADQRQFGPSGSNAPMTSLASDAAPAMAVQASRRSVDDLLAAGYLFRCDVGPRAQPSLALKVSTPPPPPSEQGIECPIDTRPVSRLEIFDQNAVPHLRNS